MDATDVKKITDNLAKERDSTGKRISMARLSKLIGVAPMTLSNWRCGNREISNLGAKMLVLLHDRPSILRDLEEYE
jgi:hypothetical protein